MDGKYYKVLGGKGLSPCTLFDYTPFLPKDGKAGAWLPEIDSAKMSSDGYYVSKYWNMWYSEGARIYEVEIDGADASGRYAVEDQICCRRIRLLRDATEELLPLLRDANFNLGESNTGERNIGSFNTGERNLGKRNTGKLNSGDFNTGDNNTGIDNVGDKNVGSANVGSLNIGHSNTGDGNVGSYNSGHYNKGNANSGSFNAGNRNSGKWNLGSYNAGFSTRATLRFTCSTSPWKTSKPRRSSCRNGLIRPIRAIRSNPPRPPTSQKPSNFRISTMPCSRKSREFRRPISTASLTAKSSFGNASDRASKGFAESAFYA